MSYWTMEHNGCIFPYFYLTSGEVFLSHILTNFLQTLHRTSYGGTILDSMQIRSKKKQL